MGAVLGSELGVLFGRRLGSELDEVLGSRRLVLK